MAINNKIVEMGGIPYGDMNVISTENVGKSNFLVFVFGSNLAGRHGAGAALEAKTKWGAEYGVGIGRTGNSYAIPTKDSNLRTLPLNVINQYVNDFKEYAKLNPDIKFVVTRIGCGLAGYKDSDIAPMFKDCTSNCLLDSEWIKVLS